MANLPAPLISRLGANDADALERLLDTVEEALRGVYTHNVEDYRESRGDDAQLFGFKVWKHLGYALEQALIDEPVLVFARVEGSYEIRLGPLRIGVYGLGHTAGDDVHGCFPDQSPFKRAFGEQNQLSLFALESVEPLPDTAAYATDSLTVGHFGNPRDGLVKWYLGAWVADELGRRRWSWIERQDQPDEGMVPLAPRPQQAPFTEQPRQGIEIRPRRPA
jgi:hypothetical protein